MQTEIDFFSGEIEPSTGETVTRMIHVKTNIHSIEIPLVEPKVEHVNPAPEVQAYYVEYIWEPDNQDG